MDMRGTFFACPCNFSQVYVINGKVGNRHYPLACLLLSGKSYIDYKYVFSILYEMIDYKGTKNIIIDFEVSVFKVMQEIFSDCQIYFCNFHFGQSYFRKIQKCVLTTQYYKKKI